MKDMVNKVTDLRLPVLNRIPLWALLVANAISLTGSMLTKIALPWFVLQTTGSAAKTGLMGFAIALPAFLAGVLGGALVDRLGFKRMSIIADVVSGLGIVLVPLLYHTIGLAFWQLLVFVFFSSLLEIPGLTARRAILPELTELAHLRLEQVNASFESIQYLASLLGPPLAGLLIVWLGANNVLWLDATTFAISAVIVAVAIPTSLFPSSSRSDRGSHGYETLVSKTLVSKLSLGTRVSTRVLYGRVKSYFISGYFDELMAGLRFLYNDRLLFSLVLCTFTVNGLGTPFFGLILPVYAKTAFGQATDLGLMIAAFGMGSLLGAIVFGLIGHRLPRRMTWISGFIIAAVPFWIFSIMPSLGVAAGVLFISGIAGGPLNPLLVTIRHERIPAALRGRVFSTFSAISVAAAPLGMVLVGYAVEGFGLRATLLVMAVCSQAVSIGMLFMPALRQMDKPRLVVDN